MLTDTGRLKPWAVFQVERLNTNDYLLLLGRCNSLGKAYQPQRL